MMRTKVCEGDESEKNESDCREEKMEAETLDKEGGTSRRSTKRPVIGLISKAGKGSTPSRTRAWQLVSG